MFLFLRMWALIGNKFKPGSSEEALSRPVFGLQKGGAGFIFPVPLELIEGLIK